MYTEAQGEYASSARGSEARELIRSCVHCGFCLEACPTYRLLGDERDGPRGRIYLIKQMVEGAPAEETRRHLDRCLTCRACETACPSGMQYGRLLEIGREIVEERGVRPLRERLARLGLLRVATAPRLFASLLALGRGLRPLLPRRLASAIPAARTAGHWPVPRHARRVAIIPGCVQPSLAPGIDAAAARVLDRLGVTAIRVRDVGCCGALALHLGHEANALAAARRNVRACEAALDAGCEAILSTASACGVLARDYERLLAADAAFAPGARRVSRAVRDLGELITPADLERAGLAGAATAAGVMGGPIAWQAPCTLQHGLRLDRHVEQLLTSLGFELAAVPDPQDCCGSAGSYALLEPGLSHKLRARKLESLQRGSPRLIATANIGCLVHLGAAAQVPVMHWIELVDRLLP